MSNTGIGSPRTWRSRTGASPKDELEPYYWRAEQLIGVGGKAGNLQGKKIDGGNVFEGPRSHEYPNPPHKLPYATTLFEKAVRELGSHPYPVLTATLSRTYTNPDRVTRPAAPTAAIAHATAA